MSYFTNQSIHADSNKKTSKKSYWKVPSIKEVWRSLHTTHFSFIFAILGILFNTSNKWNMNAMHDNHNNNWKIHKHLYICLPISKHKYWLPVFTTLCQLAITWKRQLLQSYTSIVNTLAFSCIQTIIAKDCFLFLVHSHINLLQIINAYFLLHFIDDTILVSICRVYKCIQIWEQAVLHMSCVYNMLRSIYCHNSKTTGE